MNYKSTSKEFGYCRGAQNGCVTRGFKSLQSSLRKNTYDICHLSKGRLAFFRWDDQPLEQGTSGITSRESNSTG